MMTNACTTVQDTLIGWNQARPLLEADKDRSQVFRCKAPLEPLFHTHSLPNRFLDALASSSTIFAELATSL